MLIVSLSGQWHHSISVFLFVFYQLISLCMSSAVKRTYFTNLLTFGNLHLFRVPGEPWAEETVGGVSGWRPSVPLWAYGTGEEPADSGERGSWPESGTHRGAAGANEYPVWRLEEQVLGKQVWNGQSKSLEMTRQAWKGTFCFRAPPAAIISSSVFKEALCWQTSVKGQDKLKEILQGSIRDNLITVITLNKHLHVVSSESWRRSWRMPEQLCKDRPERHKEQFRTCC